MMKHEHLIFEDFIQREFKNSVNESTQENIKFVLKTVMEKGHEIFLVGGCVRDLILKRSLNDFDFCTSAPIEDLKSLFENKDITIIDTGIEHGTITLHFKNNEDDFEITRFRKDVATDGRRATIAFTDDLQQDLERRDLTINAIAWNPILRQLVSGKDFDGIADLSNGVLKFVGDARERIAEDHLRALRFVRFWVQLRSKGFKLNTILFQSDIQPIFNSSNLSFERIVAELNKIFKVSTSLKQSEKDALVVLLDSLHLFKRFEDINWKVISKMVDFGSFFPLISNVLATEEKVSIATEKLRLSSEDVKMVSKLNQLVLKKSFEQTVLDILTKIGDRNVFLNKLNDICSLFFLNPESCKATRIELDKIKEKNTPFKLSHLALDGNDLMELGFKGAEIGDTLNQLLNLTQNLNNINTKENLLNLLKIKK